MASTPAASVPLLEMRGITKRFPGVLANDRVDFDVVAGEVHTLFGENGAGKSTLMRILYGLYLPDAGDIILRGKQTAIRSPAMAIAQGIGMIHQHFMLVPTMTVAQNVALGLKSARRPLTDLGRVSARIRQLSDTYGLAIDPNALVRQLSVGERQRVEIIKTLYRDVSLLVLDEPTAVLTPGEVRELFRVLKEMRGYGLAVVFISHKLNEVLELSDRITVLRGGRKIATVTAASTSRDELATMMVGHDVAPITLPDGRQGDARLAVTDLHVAGDRGAEAVRDLSLGARAGEILGIAGVSGNGQRELAEAIAGLRPVTGGRIVLDGTDVTGKRPAVVRHAGLGYVPEERMKDGLVADFTVTENLLLVDSTSPAFFRRGFLRPEAVRQHCTELVRDFSVRTPSLDTPARNLSGGNIQKLIMARELSRSPGVLLVAQPTRGIDVASAQYIHERLFRQRAAGTAVVVISEDLDEVMTICDRVLVMYEGRIVGEVDPRTTSREAIGLLMAGTVSGRS
ncbi:MAG: ABC transporter ATP-binding protein [Streptosporangiaceae bacterium]